MAARLAPRPGLEPALSAIRSLPATHQLWIDVGTWVHSAFARDLARDEQLVVVGLEATPSSYATFGAVLRKLPRSQRRRRSSTRTPRRSGSRQ